MAVTRDFKETVQARALRDPKFREGMLRESRWFQNRWWDTSIYALIEQDW